MTRLTIVAVCVAAATVVWLIRVDIAVAVIAALFVVCGLLLPAVAAAGIIARRVRR